MHAKNAGLDIAQVPRRQNHLLSHAHQMASAHRFYTSDDTKAHLPIFVGSLKRVMNHQPGGFIRSTLGCFTLRLERVLRFPARGQAPHLAVFLGMRVAHQIFQNHARHLQAHL